jgi:hypothetical protein
VNSINIYPSRDLNPNSIKNAVLSHTRLPFRQMGEITRQAARDALREKATQ